MDGLESIAHRPKIDFAHGLALITSRENNAVRIDPTHSFLDPSCFSNSNRELDSVNVPDTDDLS